MIRFEFKTNKKKIYYYSSARWLVVDLFFPCIAKENIEKRTSYYVPTGKLDFAYPKEIGLANWYS